MQIGKPGRQLQSQLARFLGRQRPGSNVVSKAHVATFHHGVREAQRAALERSGAKAPKQVRVIEETRFEKAVQKLLTTSVFA
ncbi:MAG TPA: hypothetical protein VGF59_20135, partial [Bryobacteraceae bacterium]